MRAPSTETQGLVIFKPDVVFLLEQGKEPWTVTNYMTNPWHPDLKTKCERVPRKGLFE